MSHKHTRYSEEFKKNTLPSSGSMLWRLATLLSIGASMLMGSAKITHAFRCQPPAIN